MLCDTHQWWLFSRFYADTPPLPLIGVQPNDLAEQPSSASSRLADPLQRLEPRMSVHFDDNRLSPFLVLWL